MDFALNNDKLKKALGDKFAFTVANTSGATVVLALFPANFPTGKADIETGVISYNSVTEIVAGGYTVGAVIDDGTVLTGLTVTAQNPTFRVRNFLRFIQSNALTMKSMTIQANNADVFAQTITVAYCSALSDYGRKYLNLSDYYGVNQTSSTKIDLLDLNLPVDDTLLMFMPIDTGRTITFTYRF